LGVLVAPESTDCQGGEDALMKIRGQQATDWQDLYEIRAAIPGALPYIRPDWVRAELAAPNDGAWPLVAVMERPAGEKVVARMDLQLPVWGRRAHSAVLTLEQHPDFGEEPGRMLTQEAIELAENWWNRHRLMTTVPANDPASVALFASLGFEREALLRQAVRITGELVDEVVLARVTGEVAQPAEPSRVGASTESSAPGPQARPEERPKVTVRGGSGDDWEALHVIWSQPDVVWGTMQIPHPSADWNRKRVQERTPPRFWPLVAEVGGQVVGNAGLSRDEKNRSHVGHVGMMVHHDFQGMGVGSALLQAAINLAQDWLGLTRIQLEVYPDNVRAVGLYEKAGFLTEGLHRAFSYSGGHYVDAFVMGRLGHE
jgi:putative acetyltransferase